LPDKLAGATIAQMKIRILATCAILGLLSTSAFGQTSEAAQLQALSKKIDEQNAKIDALSQQILKLQEQLSKPGVLIGQPSPSASSAGVTPAPGEVVPASGTTHTVAPRETLTSIARQYHVTIDELQRLNHIDDGRKLQAGQTIQIPGPASASPSPTATPNE
jgi:LysM repeat protein